MVVRIPRDNDGKALAQSLTYTQCLINVSHSTAQREEDPLSPGCGVWGVGLQGVRGLTVEGDTGSGLERVSGIGQEDEAEGTERHRKSLLRSPKGSGTTKVVMSG